MAQSSNPTITEAKAQPVNRFLKKSALTFGACLALADEVFTSSPYYNDVNKSYFRQLSDGEL